MEIKYNYVMKFENSEGYIILKDEGSEKQAKELWAKQPELKEQKIEELLKVLDEIYLGLKSVKGDADIGILIHKGNPTLMSVQEIMQSFANMIMQYEDDY